jgi:phosphatidylserine/phosphatidylglycerophosphate/cardiolipin synthase-like enzyme
MTSISISAKRRTTGFGLRALAVLLLMSALAAPVLAFQPPAGAGVIPATGTIQLAFTPEDDATTLIVQAIYDARRQVLVQTFSFTSRAIAGALINAKRRGVDVKVIADGEQIYKMRHSMVAEIAAAGVPTFVDSQHDSAHNKVMVIDAGTPQGLVITGSFNFTYAAQHRNAENLLVFRGNPQLVSAYLRNWQRHREHATPFSP